MARYYCVFRINDKERGATAEFDEKDVVSAINRMVDIAHISKDVATNGFYEYEIYEVIGPRQYITVATKLPNNKKQNGPLPYPENEPTSANLLAARAPPLAAVNKPAVLFTIGKL